MIRAERQAEATVEEAAAKDVHVHEGVKGVCISGEKTDALVVRVHALGHECRILVEFAEILCPAREAVVIAPATEVGGRERRLWALVDDALPGHAAAREQPHDAVGRVDAIAHALAHDDALAVDAADTLLATSDVRADGLCELRQHALVGIKVKDPIRGGLFLREIPLPGKARLRHRMTEDARACRLSDADGVVRAARVDDEDLVREADARDAIRDMVRLVAREDQDGQGRHGRSELL